jgi:hypothetical protein
VGDFDSNLLKKLGLSRWFSALTPIGFGRLSLPETFLRNGEGRTTQNGRATERAAPHGKDATALAAIVENSGMRSDKPLLHGEILSSIIDSFCEVHRELGILRESVQAP